MLLGAPAQASLPFPFLVTFHLSPVPVPALSCRGLQLWVHHGFLCNTCLVWLRVGSSAHLGWLEEVVQPLLCSQPWIHIVERSRAHSSRAALLQPLERSYFCPAERW